jgi:hypothetical protein
LLLQFVIICHELFAFLHLSLSFLKTFVSNIAISKHKIV